MKNDSLADQLHNYAITCEVAKDARSDAAEFKRLDAEIAELRALVKDRLDWYTRSGRTPTMLSGEWIERARKALGYSEPEGR